MNIDIVDEIINKNLELKVNGLEEQLNATTLTQLGMLFNNFNSVFTLNYFFLNSYTSYFLGLNNLITFINQINEFFYKLSFMFS